MPWTMELDDEALLWVNVTWWDGFIWQEGQIIINDVCGWWSTELTFTQIHGF
jgi:hypothetical protein